MAFPAADTPRDYLVNMLEYFPWLAIRVGNIFSAQPFVEQINLAVNIGRKPHHCRHMAFFHAQHQIGAAQYGGRQLVRTVHAAVDAVFGKQLQGSRVHGAADERAESGTGELDVAPRHALPEQVLGHGAAADIARADDQYPFEHSADLLPEPGQPASVRTREMAGGFIIVPFPRGLAPEAPETPRGNGADNQANKPVVC